MKSQKSEKCMTVIERYKISCLKSMLCFLQKSDLGILWSPKVIRLEGIKGVWITNLVFEENKGVFSLFSLTILFAPA